ncbi:hypothetical protein G5I_11135 [Acromyrmex echinatior]|uniref:Secreted protein n=1 Tax=Acromyrmex echinatior TaxID=103372 RepID=F4WYS1_ACREC|nr:hypothetical protein G5I_11135 [Acromyrmex echinatior]
MSVVFWIMILIVKGRIARRSVHHAGRLSVHHVAHRRIRTVCPTWSCRQWWKHYTLLRLDLCSVIGRRVLDKLAVTPSKVLEELETLMPTRYSVSSWQRGRMREIEKSTYRGARAPASLSQIPTTTDGTTTMTMGRRRRRSDRQAEGRFVRRKSEMCSGTFNNPSMKLLVIRDAIPDTPDLITHPPCCCLCNVSIFHSAMTQWSSSRQKEARQIYLGCIVAMEVADAFYRGIVTKCPVRSQLYGTSVPMLRFYCVVLAAREGTTILPVLPTL